MGGYRSEQTGYFFTGAIKNYADKRRISIQSIESYTMNTTRYKINGPSVVSEVIDGEAVIVNMDNGSYYSVDDSGAFIWDLVCQGANVSEIIALIEKSYAGSDVEIEKTVSELIEQLLKEALIVESEGALQSSAEAGSFEEKFTAPELKKYTDMEELLLLDPIHEEGDTNEEQRRVG